MKKTILQVLFTAVLAALTLSSCNKDNSYPVISIVAGDYFSADFTEDVTLYLSQAASADLNVNLGVAGTSQPGYTALPGSHLDFPAMVTISAGATSVSFTVTVKNPDKLASDEYSAGIQLMPGRGYSVKEGSSIAYIKLKIEGSSYGEGGGESTPGAGSESGWTISYDGFKPFTYQSEGQSVTENCEVFSYTVPASQYVYMAVFDAGTYSEYINGKSKSDIIALVQNCIDEDIADYKDYGVTMTAADLVYAGPDQVGYEEFENGNYEAFIFGTSAAGVPDGRYAWCSFTKTGSSIEDGGDDSGDDGDDDFDYPDDITSVTLKTNWSVSFIETIQDDGTWYDKCLVTAPGSKYVDLLWITDEDLADFEDDLEVVNFWQYYCYSDYEDYMDTPGDYFYVNGENAYYKHEVGTWTVYLIEFNTDWTVTGNYSKNTVTIPTHPTADKLMAKPFPRYKLSKQHMLRTHAKPVKVSAKALRK